MNGTPPVIKARQWRWIESCGRNIVIRNIAGCKRMCNPIINRRLLWCFLENSGCSSAASFTFKYAEKDLCGCSAFKDGRV